MNEELKVFLQESGLCNGQHILVHSSYRNIRKGFPGISIKEYINTLQKIITPAGSVLMPAFTYCFKRDGFDYNFFDKSLSPSKTGAVSEVFRTTRGVARTSSATHSFAIWGKLKRKIKLFDYPESPLGNGSLMELLAKTENSFVLMAGTDFSSFTFGHYLEVIAKVPWYDFSPWEYLSVLPVGVSLEGEQRLKEIPGCSRKFVNFEKYLELHNLLQRHKKNEFVLTLIPIRLLLQYGIGYFSDNYDSLLCPIGRCKACDSRHKKFDI